jgi:hypothetical protein
LLIDQKQLRGQDAHEQDHEDRRGQNSERRQLEYARYGVNSRTPGAGVLLVFLTAS